ncbi:transketolase [Candidatus Omnitrophota bacterium]
METKTIKINKKTQCSSLDARSLYLRKLIIMAAEKAKRGHFGGALSMIEILRVLYDDIMQYRPKDPRWKKRDRFILSKGHGCLALYAILADKGFFSIDELKDCFQKNSCLGGHPEIGKVLGIEASTGSLGHGLSLGIGMALAIRMQNNKSRVFVLLGDGELNEGSIWEAAMYASKHKLANLTTIIDYNKVQSAGTTKEILDLEPLVEKWKSFGFQTKEVDGHNLKELKKVFEGLPFKKDKPSAIICHTVKCKGIPFAEDDAKWHYKRIDDAMIKKMYAALGE